LGRVFVGMALLYPWATKDYLLWEMTIGQLFYYYNEGMEMKYPDPEKYKNPNSFLAGAADEDVVKKREELRQQYGMIGE
jgi:hypothetical protein